MGYEISSEYLPHFFHLKSLGEISPHGVMLIMDKLVSSPQWKPGSNLLIDYRNGIRDHFTYNDISMIAEIICSHKEKLGDGKCAFLVDNPQERWITRIYKFLCSGKVYNEINIFETFDKAVSWLREENTAGASR